MAYILKTNISNKANYGSERNTSNIKWAVVHYTGNDGDSDEGNGNYFHNNIVKASAQLFVDDDSVTQSVPDNFVAYSVGGLYAPKEGGGAFYKQCTNANSINIELCDTQKNGTYDFSEATLDNAASLIRSIMDKYGIDIDHVIRHFDVNNKICPAPFVNDINVWNAFKARIMGSPAPAVTPVAPAPTPTVSAPASDADVLELQRALNADGYTNNAGNRLVEDGRWGNNTSEAAAKAVVKAKYNAKTRKWTVGTTGEVVKFVQRRVGCADDGKCGPGTRSCIITYQNQHSLSPDGCAGAKTLKSLCF